MQGKSRCSNAADPGDFPFTWMDIAWTKTLRPQCSTHIHELINCHGNNKLEAMGQNYNEPRTIGYINIHNLT